MNRDWLEQIMYRSIEKLDLHNLDENQAEELIISSIRESLPDLIETIDSQLMKNLNRNLKEERASKKSFIKDLASTWKTAFDLLEYTIELHFQYGFKLNESTMLKKNQDLRFHIHFQLHARACQVSREILSLIKQGYADGAMGRWRTLYEISVISCFLHEKPFDLFERYWNYSKVESHFELLELKKNYAKLGEDPVTDEEVKASQREIETLQNQYGSDYTKPYGWIGEYLNKKKWNFSGIEETVQFKFMRSHYKWANNYIHSGPKSMQFKLGLWENWEDMLAGPSNYGFADPAQNTAYSLLQVSTTLSDGENRLEDAVYLEVFGKMLDRVGDEFIRIQRSLSK